MRYFIEIAYKGTNYHGWQLQPNAISVQEEINRAFSKILSTTIEVVGAGRTDTGVHAKQLFAHVDINSQLDVLSLIYKVNAVLPNDISILNIKKVTEDAHARFDAVSRSYEYKILRKRNPFEIELAWELLHLNIDIPLMNEAAAYLLEVSNFQCFSKSNSDVKTYICDVTEAFWVEKDDFLIFKITADRFLRNMVRAIVGTLLEVGTNKISIQDFKQIIKSKNRSNAGPSAPPQGLYLTKVEYPKTIWNE